MSSPRGRVRRRWLIVIGMFSLLATLIVWAVRGFGDWLVVSDPLEPARAIVVLSGEIPYRAEEAAGIFREKLVPEVWLTPEPPNTEFARLGIDYHETISYNEQVLAKLGVPPSAIRIIPRPARDTHEELTGIIQELRRVGGDQVILVTSPYHTRRVSVIWRQLARALSPSNGDIPRAIVRPAAKETINTRHWWRDSDDVKLVGHEFFGLLNAWAGYPLGPWSE